MSAAPATANLFRRLAAETDESAAVALFVELCRGSAQLRHWLWEDFGRDVSTRAKFAEALKRGDGAFVRFADLTGEGSAWQTERELLKAKLPRQYGGRTFDELAQLLVRHQAGGIDLAAFLLAAEWHRRAPRETAAPAQLHGAVEFVRAAMRSGSSSLLRDLDRAAQLTKEFTHGAGRRALLGFPDWWKTHALLYMLRHPAPAYRTRDLRAYLTSLGLNVSTRRIREFCTEQGIRRDMRAGRPRTRPPDSVRRSKSRSAAGGSG